MGRAVLRTPEIPMGPTCAPPHCWDHHMQGQLWWGGGRTFQCWGQTWGDPPMGRTDPRTPRTPIRGQPKGHMWGHSLGPPWPEQLQPPPSGQRPLPKDRDPLGPPNETKDSPGDPYVLSSPPPCFLSPMAPLHVPPPPKVRAAPRCSPPSRGPPGAPQGLTLDLDDLLQGGHRVDVGLLLQQGGIQGLQLGRGPP